MSVEGFEMGDFSLEECRRLRREIKEAHAAIRRLDAAVLEAGRILRSFRAGNGFLAIAAYEQWCADTDRARDIEHAPAIARAQGTSHE